jgi:diguanylate cyclase (GGDEF)-like protein
MMSLSRLRTDFQFAIVVSFGLVAVLGIVPFAIYRFTQGELLIAGMDTAVAASLLACVAYAWYGDNVERAGLLLAIFASIGGVAAAMLLGWLGLLWMYPLLLANFLLISRGRALVASTLAIGWLVIDGRMFDSDLHRLSFLATAAIVCAFAWIFAQRTARQREKLEALAEHDPLTGVNNRRAMEHELLLAIETHQRNLGAYGLAVLDLDHFKRINDRYGHEAGDATLLAFTALVERSIRKLDRFFRIGGEEFVLLLPGVNADGLAMLCEHLRARIAAQLRCRDETVTVSIGTALLRNGDDTASWLMRADEALYRAKSAGRNRVEAEDRSDTRVRAGMEPGESSLAR